MKGREVPRRPTAEALKIVIKSDKEGTGYAAGIAGHEYWYDGASPDEALGYLIREHECFSGFPLVIASIDRDYQ